MRNLIHPDTSPLPACLLILFALYFAVAFGVVLYLSLDSPYVLEWLEGGTMDTVQRVTQGLPIYVPPTLEYTPFMYTPLYYYIAAMFTFIFGMDFIAGRMVSVCAIFGLCWLLYAWMRKENAHKKIALLAPALFLATFATVSSWFHLARVDSLFVFLTFAGLFIYRHHTGTATAVAAGVTLALAFFTKQQAAICVLPVLLLGFFAWPRRTAIVTGVFFAYALAMVLIFEHASNGWFSLYVFEMPATLPMNFGALWEFWPRDIFKVMPIAFALCAFGVWRLLIEDWRAGLFYVGLLAGTLGGAWGSRVHVLGWANVLMPAYTALALVCALTVSLALRQGWMHRNACYLLLVMQMCLLLYNPFAQSPRNSPEIAKKYVEYIAAIPGEVLIPDMQFQQTKAGKKSYAYRMNAVDIMQADFGERNYIKENLKQELQEALQQKKFSAIIVSRHGDVPQKNAYYRFKEKIVNEKYSPLAVTGWMEFPNYVYVPKE